MSSYCSYSDLYTYIQQETFDSLGFTSSVLTTIITQHSAFVDSCFKNGGYTLPIVSFSDDVKINFINYIIYQILNKAAYDKDTQVYQNIRFDFDRALKFFEEISSGNKKPLSIVDSSSPSTVEKSYSYYASYSTDY